MSAAPRWLDAAAAADYLSMREPAFQKAVKAGTVPKPSRHLGPRTPRWDRLALDAVMSGNTATDTRSVVDALAEEIQTQGRARRQTQAA